ncbi:MAG: PP2C family protein-serine/threonine phosphatase, partial [Flavobacteriales bacterium]
SSQHQGPFVLAVADCTGHGVPGALVSIACNNALNRAVSEFGLRDPGEIFDKTRELLIENFAKSDDDVKDGMDASLCALKLSEGRMKWSGANIPLWIYRKKQGLIEQIKGDRQSIGKVYDYKPFKTHDLEVSAGDVIYLFSDGYADQFGGLSNKKLTKAKFRELLMSIAELPASEQRIRLLDFQTTFRNGMAQVDDICVIGIVVE